MSGGAELQPYQTPTQTGYGIGENLGSTGQNFLNDLISRQDQGLPENIKNMMLKSVEDAQNSAVVSAKRQMKEATAGKQLPTGTLINSLADLYSQKSKAIGEANRDIAFKDYDIQNQNRANALQGYMGLQGLASGIAGGKNQLAFQLANMKNNYNLNKYQIDEQNSFGWGDLFGGLFGMGGQVLGGMASGGTGFFKP